MFCVCVAQLSEAQLVQIALQQQAQQMATLQLQQQVMM